MTDTMQHKPQFSKRKLYYTYINIYVIAIILMCTPKYNHTHKKKKVILFQLSRELSAGSDLPVS